MASLNRFGHALALGSLGHQPGAWSTKRVGGPVIAARLVRIRRDTA